MARVRVATLGEAQAVARKGSEATIYTDDKGFYIVEVIVKED